MFDQQANNISDNKRKNNLSNVFTFLYFVGITQNINGPNWPHSSYLKQKFAQTAIYKTKKDTLK